jgi:SAM-dependent methyltransferase
VISQEAPLDRRVCAEVSAALFWRGTEHACEYIPTLSYQETRGKGVAAYVQATGRDTYWHALAEQRSRFVDDHGALRPELVEDVSCAVCGPAEARHAFEKDGFPYLRCAVCGTVFIGTQLREEVLDEFWSTAPVAAMWLDVLLSRAQLEFDRRKFNHALEDVERLRGGPGSVLDIGSSVGTFLDVAQGRGWTVAGVEPGQRARLLARETYDLELAPDLAALGEGQFDLVTFWEVVEHTKRPAELLTAAGPLLAEGSILVSLVGGNAGALANRIMRASSAAFDFARLWYFTPSSYGSLLDQSGLQQIDTQGVLSEVDTAINYLRYDDPYRPASDESVLDAATIDALQTASSRPELAYKFLSIARRNNA